MQKEESITTNESPMVTQFPGDLLDYFAGQALAGIYTADYWHDLTGNEKHVANICYAAATAMIAEKRRLEALE